MKYKRKRLPIKNSHLGTMFDSWHHSYCWSVFSFWNWSVSRVGNKEIIMSGLWSQSYFLSWSK